MAKLFKYLILGLAVVLSIYLGWMTVSGDLEDLFNSDSSTSEITDDNSEQEIEITETAAPLIASVPGEYAIEANVTLTGSGTGYHAKLVIAAKDSAVSFGIQYDQYGEGAYNDETSFLIENIKSNDTGGQEYTRTGYSSLGDTYNLMLSVDNDGTCRAYVNGEKVGSVVNKDLIGKDLYLRVEGSGRINSDSVKAVFEDIKLKGSGVYLKDKIWRTHNFDTNEGIHSDVDNFKNDQTIIIEGTVKGLTPEEDWDSAYESVSGITQFIE